MSKNAENIARLSPKQRKLFEQLLKQEGRNTELLPIARQPRDTYTFPLSFAQQRMWFLYQLTPDNVAYNISTAVSLTGPLSLSVFELALREIVRRHEIFRTIFKVVEGQPAQVIKPHMDIPLRVIDLRDLASPSHATYLQSLAYEEAQSPFNLTRGPLLRITLLWISEQNYALLLTMHHIISDGWSLNVFVQEMIALYTAFIAGKPTLLPELPIQYADFTRWQREWLQGERLEALLTYWKQQLAEAPALLTLPLDKPRPPAQTYQGALQSIMFPRSLLESLKELSRNEHVTLFMTLLAAFQVLLSYYSGQDDIVVGTPVANRTRSELANLIGFFANTLVLRTKIAGEFSFRKLLQHVRETTLNAYTYQDMPFEYLVEILQPERNISHTPLFQVAFTLQDALQSQLHFADLDLQWLDVDTGTAKFDLTLSLSEDKEGLKGAIEYNRNLFEPETISRMLEHLRVLLEEVTKYHEKRLSALQLLTQAEKERLLVQWNDTRIAYPQEQLLHQLFEAQVVQTPDTIAVVFDEKQLTYRELNRRSNQLAYHLQALDVTPDTLVGVYMERSLELVVALLGILKVGGAYVPFDPDYPAQRLSWMLAESNVAVLLTQQCLLERLPEHVAQLVVLDEDQPVLAGKEAENLTIVMSSENLAYMIYTSGSTGRPKGVMNTHRGICNRLLWMQEAYHLVSDDRVLQKTPYSFDVSVWEFFWPLLVGARLVIAQPEKHRDSAYLIEVIQEQQITTIHFVPSMLSVLMEAPALEGCRSLKRIICSGEALSLEVQERLFARLPVELYNLYGPTEAAVDVTAWACTNTGAWRSVPIGRPISNISLYILDSYLRPVPVGVPGELYIGGVGLARGYHRRPDLTAERFFPDPWGKELGARLYRTGDLVRYLPDGNIEYLGRLDHQIKLRGFRIELGEIEETLNEHPAVQEAVILAREDRPGDRQLVAYLVPDARYAYPVRRFFQLKAASTLESHQYHELPNGLLIAIQNKSETDFLYKEIFEEQTYIRHGIHLPNGACVFDVGANIGLFSLYVGLHCRDARIYPFEPIPAVFETLRLNMTLYGLHARPFAYGLSEASGSETFTYYPHVSLLSGRFANTLADREVVKAFLSTQQEYEAAELAVDELLVERLASELITCPVRTLSEMMYEQGIEQIDLLKIDVERSELEVLLGIEEDDWHKIKQIVVETGEDGATLAQITTLLKRRGYTVTVGQGLMLQESRLYNIYAVQPTLAYPLETSFSLEQRYTWSSPERLKNAVRETLKDRLPAYMLPAALVMLDELPLTTNGKINRKVLPPPDSYQSEQAKSFVVPRNDLERQLAEIWEKLLHVHPIGATDDFFELGGHSLLALQLIARIEEQLGQIVPLSFLFQTPSIEKLAQFLQQQMGVASWSPLVAMQPYGTKRPFFCVHPSPGNVFSYADLAHYLGPDQPFYGLQARGVDGKQIPLNSVEEMAEYYIQALRTVQPTGPYLLGGHSFGGIVAYEIAQQLYRQGDKVALLAILDTPAPITQKSSGTPPLEGTAHLLADAAALLARFSEKQISLSYAVLQGMETAQQLEYTLQSLQSSGLLVGEVDVAPLQGFLQVQQANVHAMSLYRPQVYKGHLSLFLAERMKLSDFDEAQCELFFEETFGWDELTPGQVKTYITPGDHISMLRPPYVQALAKQLKDCLEQAQASGNLAVSLP